jgi:hypothetical protein
MSLIQSLRAKLRRKRTPSDAPSDARITNEIGIHAGFGQPPMLPRDDKKP